MIFGSAKAEKANEISDTAAVSLYVDFRPPKHFSRYPLHSTLKTLEPATMSEDEVTDDEMTPEEERKLRKLKEESKPLEGLAFLFTRTREYEALLKEDRKRKEAKRRKEEQTSEDTTSSRAQDDNTGSGGSNSNKEPSDRADTATLPLHIVRTFKVPTCSFFQMRQN